MSYDVAASKFQISRPNISKVQGCVVQTKKKNNNIWAWPCTCVSSTPPVLIFANAKPVLIANPCLVDVPRRFGASPRFHSLQQVRVGPPILRKVSTHAQIRMPRSESQPQRLQQGGRVRGMLPYATLSSRPCSFASVLPPKRSQASTAAVKTGHRQKIQITHADTTGVVAGYVV